MKALIDSSIIIDHLRNYQHGKDTRFMMIYKECEAIYFCLITIAEIFSGLSAVKMEEQINDIFSLGNIIELNLASYGKSGRNKKRNKNISHGRNHICMRLGIESARSYLEP